MESLNIPCICGIHLTSLRNELVSGVNSLCRVWTEAVAEFFREWRALISWLRGTITWQIHKQEEGGGKKTSFQHI